MQTAPSMSPRAAERRSSSSRNARTPWCSMDKHRAAARIALVIVVGLSSALRLDAAPTFTRDVAPILFEHCGQCHHPDGPAPFSLVSYDDAKRRARLIADATTSRLMPPWKSEPGYGDFVGQRFLTAAELLTLREWSRPKRRKATPRTCRRCRNGRKDGSSASPTSS